MNMQDKGRPAITSTRDLRAFLVEQMQGVSDGKVNYDKAKAVCNIAQQVYNTLNVEVKMAIARSKLPEGQEIEPVNFND